MKKGTHGSVLVHLKDGIVTGVKFHEDFNVSAFVDHVEKPVKIAVVKSYKKIEHIKETNTPIKDEQNVSNLHEMTENDNMSGNIDKEKVK